MTAINVVCLADRVVLISDGVAIDRKGRVARLMQKLSPIPHLNMVVGVRGAPALASIVLDRIQEEFTSYDGAYARISNAISSAFTSISPTWERAFGPNIMSCDIVIGGWSESRGPHAFLLATHSLHAASGIVPWEPIEIGGMLFTPSDANLDRDFKRMQFQVSHSAAIDLVSRQRHVVTPMPDYAELTPNVGGFVQFVTVERDRIESRIIHRYSDEIGLPITP